MKNNTQKRTNKSKIALNCIFGSLALLGSAGTIVFGTLWCQNRNNGNTPQPGTDAIEVNLTQHQTVDVPEAGTIYYVYDNVDIVANQKYRFNIDLSLADYPEESEFSVWNIYLMDNTPETPEIIKSYGLFEIFIDDVKFYDFISNGVYSSLIEQIYWSAESELPELPDTFNWNSSIITFDIDFPSSYNDAEIGWLTYE